MLARFKFPILLGLSITILFSALKIFGFLPLDRLDTLFYDLKFKLKGKVYVPKEVVIVAIDDKSLEQIGRWPWERSKIAKLIDNLKRLGAKVIMLDIILSEPSDTDDILSNSIKKAENVVLPIVFDMKGERKKESDDLLFENAFPFVKGEENLKLFSPPRAKGVLIPQRKFSEHAKALGHINMFADEDGVLRREYLVVEYEGEFYPSISLQVARVYLGLPQESLVFYAAKGVQIGNKFIPTDFFGGLLIHYYGKEGTFPHVSAQEVFNGKVEKEKIEGKIVLVGATAAGLFDLRVTPSSPSMPGVEKHATVIGSILKGDFILRAPNYINVAFILLTGIVFSLIIQKLRPVSGFAFALFSVFSIFILNYHIFFWKKIWFDFSYSAANLVLIYVFVTAYRYATEERHARKIRAIFSSYVTEKLVNELVKNPNLVRLGGERREVTVLFSDIRGFTTFSEKHTPEEVVARLNEYLGEMSHIILSWDGTLDKFVGDEIVAFWGAPVKQENHAELAVKCAMDMVRKLVELQKKWELENKPILDAGIGLNTGEVLVGNIGAEGKKMDYTVIGDHVNLGARVEKLTRNYNARILITEFTMEKIKDIVERGELKEATIRYVGTVKVKGKEKPVGIYEIIPSLPSVVDS